MTTETIIVNGKWNASERRVSSLTDNQQDALKVHLRNLEVGQPILESLGFEPTAPTAFFRGQPQTGFTHSERPVDVMLVGLGHWQVYDHHQQVHGTRDEANLNEVLGGLLAKYEVAPVVLDEFAQDALAEDLS